MSARDEITHLMNRYCFAVDTGDIDGFAGLFEHGEWSMEGAEVNVGKQWFLETLSGVIIYEDGNPKSRHIMNNVDLYNDEEAGTATSQCYVTVIQQTDNFPLQPIFSGHYFDEFACVDGTWRFAKRTIRNQLVGDLSAHLKVPVNTVPAA
jgi:hypothetical protein